MNKTGYAPGRVEPIVDFASRDGEVVLPPTTEDARWLYRTYYQNRGWEWCEASTLAEVDALQDRLVSLEKDKMDREMEHDEKLLAPKREEIRSNLSQRMISAKTGEWEKEFIRLYMQLRDEKKKEAYRQRYLERTSYLWIREMDANTKATDRMLSEPGDRWERSG
jgi:hypothetical protein